MKRKKTRKRRRKRNTRKKRLVVANWKMYPKTAVEARRLFKATVRRVSRIRTARVVVCPPTLYLGELAHNYRGTRVSFGAQDVFIKRGVGSHTGEVSTDMLKDVGAKYVIIGHSERRARGETNKAVAQKTNAVLSVGMVPIVCVGERERDIHGDYLGWLEEEVRESLALVPKKKAGKLVLAYEPIWAIGKSAEDAMKPRDLHEMTLFLKKVLVKLYGRKIGERIKILYGGSVEPENDDALMAEGSVDGLLVGHVSLDAKQFTEVVRGL